MDKLLIKYGRLLLMILILCFSTNAFAGLENIHHQHTYNLTVGRSIYLSWANLYNYDNFAAYEAYGGGNGQITISPDGSGVRITALKRTTGTTLVYVNYTIHTGTTWNPHTVCHVHNCWFNIVELESVHIPNQLKMLVGESNKLQPVLTPSTASTAYTWHSSNTAVAEVNEEGEITAISPGETTITCTTHNGKHSKCTVTVEPVKIQSLEVSPTELNLKKNESAQIATKILPENASIKDLEWESSNENVAIVSPNGKIVAVNPGVAFVTANTKDGSNLSSEVIVYVAGNEVTEIELSENDITLAEEQTVKLSATVLPANADNKILDWSSSNTTVASVAQDGTVTALTQGEAIITAKATDGSETSASCRVTVVKPVENIAFDKSWLELKIGETYDLVAEITPADATNTTLEWESSDENVVTVENGTVTALTQGEVIITAKATDGSETSASCRVTVIKPVESIALDKSWVELKTGETYDLVAEITPADATNITLEWESSDENVATVENGTVTALNPGETVITVYSVGNPDAKAICNVTVSGITGVQQITGSPISVQVLESTIHIKGLEEASVIKIFNGDGILVYQGADRVIRNLGHGFYIVVAGEKTFKVVI